MYAFGWINLKIPKSSFVVKKKTNKKTPVFQVLFCSFLFLFGDSLETKEMYLGIKQ